LQLPTYGYGLVYDNWGVTTLDFVPCCCHPYSAKRYGDFASLFVGLFSGGILDRHRFVAAIDTAVVADP
jgi:hypothetical protein